MRLDVTLGLRLRLLWTVSGVTHAELAAKAGIGTTTLTNMFWDKTRPRRENVEAVAGALGVPTTALEDDVECFLQMTRICGVVMPGTAPTLSGELADILSRVPPERATHALGMLRAMLGLMEPAPAPASPNAVEPSRRQERPAQRLPPSSAASPGEGDGHRDGDGR